MRNPQKGLKCYPLFLRLLSYICWCEKCTYNNGEWQMLSFNPIFQFTSCAKNHLIAKRTLCKAATTTKNTQWGEITNCWIKNYCMVFVKIVNKIFLTVETLNACARHNQAVGHSRICNVRVENDTMYVCKCKLQTMKINSMHFSLILV